MFRSKPSYDDKGGWGGRSSIIGGLFLWPILASKGKSYDLLGDGSIELINILWNYGGVSGIIADLQDV